MSLILVATLPLLIKFAINYVEKLKNI